MPTCLPLVTRPSGILTSDTFTLFKPSSDPKSTVAPLYSCQQLINSLASYTGMLEPPYYVQDGYVQDGNVCKVDKHEFQCLRNGYKVSSRPNPKRYIIRLINITMDFTSTQIPDVQQCKRGEKGNIGRALSHR